MVLIGHSAWPYPEGRTKSGFFEEPASIGAAGAVPADEPSHYLANLHNKP